MKSIEQIRRENLIRVINECAHGNQTEASKRLEHDRPTLVNHWKAGRKNIKTESARKIEAAFDLPDFWMDSEHDSSHLYPAMSREKSGLINDSTHRTGSTLDRSNTERGPEVAGKLPIISWVQAGTWDAAVDKLAAVTAEDWMASPIATSSNAYFLRMRGESMFSPDGEPSFRENDLILVEPLSTAENGSLVVVLLPGDTEVTFRQIIVEGERRYLKALNPSWPHRIIEVTDNIQIRGVVRTKVVRY